MMDYDWPGNVRELRHAVEYAVVTSDRGRIERSFLPANIRAAIASNPGRLEADPEARRIAIALESNRWNVARTAKDLGISRTTLWRRMKRFGIDRTA
jgi:transcriptional regulator of acetoin/glycerol metabolism